MRIIGALLAVFLIGCQSPRASYTNGLIVWCSSSAVGIGWGEYVEVPQGGILERSITTKGAAVKSNAPLETISYLKIDNGNVISNDYTIVELPK